MTFSVNQRNQPVQFLFNPFFEVTMRSDLNEFVTKYLTLVGATVMAVGFVAFVATSYDETRAEGQTSAVQGSIAPSQTTGS
ncbi:MAG: hypothetical protein BWK72_05985 [Rhodoferax ferrireducens]|uniref:Uncharacterized protein n=1 Tax=Rhodoferax ferrireducens TaxID=192843 RepID=A0A1W9KXT5_9BURK|nr:MAG: hypothetical protein BWK72_05985 [Rhodoferax ferrireducens]